MNLRRITTGLCLMTFLVASAHLGLFVALDAQTRSLAEANGITLLSETTYALLARMYSSVAIFFALATSSTLISRRWAAFVGMILVLPTIVPFYSIVLAVCPSNSHEEPTRLAAAFYTSALCIILASTAFLSLFGIAIGRKMPQHGYSRFGGSKSEP